MPTEDHNQNFFESSGTNEAAGTIDERSGYCFGCGPANPQGLQLVFSLDATHPETLIATAPVQLTAIHQGPPGYIHGGIIATLLDEGMSKPNRPLNVLAMTRHLEIDYLHPAPLDQPLTLIGRHLRCEGRKLFHQAELCNAEGKVLARGKGLFIAIQQRHFDATSTSAKPQLRPNIPGRA